MNKHHHTRCAIALLALAAVAFPAAAQSSDFSTWSAHGDVLSAGTLAQLTTAAVDSGETPLSAHSALLFDELESRLGVYFEGDTYEGSAITTSFAAAAGTRVALQWSFVTADFDPLFADRAYAIIDGAPHWLVQADGGAQGGTFSHSFTLGGVHTLGFAVWDVNDVTGVSTLGLSSLSVSAVPEPAGFALLLAGLGLVGGVAGRRR